MPITRSVEDLSNIEGSDISQNRGAVPRVQTRSMVRDSERERDDINGRIDSQISTSMIQLRDEMTSMISSEIRSLVQNLTVQPQNSSPRLTSPQNNASADISPEGNSGNGDARDNEKISNIIRNWRVKFNGSAKDINVDEFVYRINVLTDNHLSGNYALLVHHAHTLFEGKALQWYWRYHRQSNDIDWFRLCDALKRQFKDFYTDSMLNKEIRQRSQKPSESFDDFLDSVISLCDRLKSPLDEDELCEIIIGNLKSDLRHELIHLEITTIARLRKEVRIHENFMKDIRSNNPKYSKTFISEVISNTPGASDTEVCVLGNVQCWNCGESGHTYFDCVKPRRVFCYGCGALNVYRPNCAKCCPGNVQRDVRLPNNGHPKMKKNGK